jgi:hypothetical protein
LGTSADLAESHGDAAIDGLRMPSIKNGKELAGGFSVAVLEKRSRL